jgi:hypothetical protein
MKLKHSEKFITYEIRESDEDNFEESAEEGSRQKNLAKNEGLGREEGQTISCQNLEGGGKNHKRLRKTERSRDLKINRQSNSPYLVKKKAGFRFSVSKVLSQTHFQGKEWKGHKESVEKKGKTFSTIYGKSMGGGGKYSALHDFSNSERKTKNNNKERDFKTKIIKEIEQISKY